MSRPLPARLYLIADSRHPRRSLLETVVQALEAGVRFLQLRERELSETAYCRLAEAVIERARSWGASVLLNGRVELVGALGADGVHLREGQAVARAREVLGPEPWVGVSVHRAADLSSLAEEGADFAVFSPIFPTRSKPGAPGVGLEALREAVCRSSVPVFALGGVTPERVASCLEAGAWGVAVLHPIMAAEDVARVVRDYLRRIEGFPYPTPKGKGAPE